MGSKAGRESLSWLLMTLFKSIPCGAVDFLLSLCQSTVRSSSLRSPPPSVYPLFVYNLHRKCVQTEDALLTYTVHFAVVNHDQPLLLDKSNRARLWVLTNRWTPQLIPPLVFVKLYNVCCWWTRPSAAFLAAWSRLWSTWGRLVDLWLFKVITVTVHRINRLLLLPLLLPL